MTDASKSTITNGLSNDALSSHFNGGLSTSVPSALDGVNPVYKGDAGKDVGGFAEVVGDNPNAFG